jgi:hypothetical protein
MEPLDLPPLRPHGFGGVGRRMRTDVTHPAALRAGATERKNWVATEMPGPHLNEHGGTSMTAFIVVRCRVKPGRGCHDAFPP